MKVSFHTLGCKLNFSETSTIARQFEQGGYTRVSSGKESDICVINTCSVTEHADKKCRNLIRKLHRENPSAIIAVTGCYAQLKPGEVATVEGVALVLSNNDKGELFRQVVELVSERGRNGDTTAGATVFSCETAELTNFFSAFSSGDRTRSFLKVQDGCDYKCTYCTIHNARGASRNISIADAVAQARGIAAAGQKEIVLTGINTGDFGRATGEKFIDLLRALDAVEGVERYRISSIEPNLLTDEIIDFCAGSAKFQHHFHIPLQSGSDDILRLMRRRYNAAMFADRIVAIRRRMPDAFIGIDVIAGFPGETEERFMETYRLLESVAPAFLHIFPYSERADTPAITFPGKVAPADKTDRAARLGALCEKLHRDFYESQSGREADVLFENSVKGGYMYGFTGNYVKVKTPTDRSLANRVVRVALGAPDDGCEMTATILQQA